MKLKTSACFALTFAVLMVLCTATFAETSKLNKEKSSQSSSMARSKPIFAPGSRELISRRIRERVFKKANLTEEVSRLDELDRDILIMDLWKKPLSEVNVKYPKISHLKLKEAQRLLAEETQ